MKLLNALVVISLLLGIGCAGLGTVAGNLTKPADPNQPQGPTVLERQVGEATQGTPWAPIAASAAALVVAGINHLVTRRVAADGKERTDRLQRESDEHYDRERELLKAGRPS